MLDNNEVINAVLAKPTCKREKEDLNAIIEKSSVLEKTIDPSAGNASVINF